MEHTPQRAPVTRELVFRRALAIVDADGLAALTMRRLAADLGVEAASLYHHVPNKRAVLDGALSVMRAEMVFPDPLPTDWRDLMEVIFLRYLDLLRDHPHMLPFAGRHLETDPAEGLPYLVSLGMPEGDAVALWQSVLAFVVGFATFASATMIGEADHLGGGLPARMARWDRSTARHGLRALLDSYAVAAPDNRPDRVTPAVAPPPGRSAEPGP